MSISVDDDYSNFLGLLKEIENDVENYRASWGELERKKGLT